MSKEKILAMQKQVTGKLMAAISMLLVSAILMCLTSYAWFILSTAPEVSNLKTTAGANGALEIALQSTNKDGTGRAEITSAVGSSHAKKSAAESNTYWGNVVDLTEGYGLDNIQLYPSRLKVNATEVDGKTSYTVDTGSILQVPQFGQDGRVTSLLNATKTHYNKDGQFVTGANWGVNVLGAVNADKGDQGDTITLTYRRDTVLKQAREKVAAYRAELRDKVQQTIEKNSLGIMGLIFEVTKMFFSNDALPSIESDIFLASVRDYVSTMDTVVTEASDALRWALMAYAAADEERFDSSKEEDMKNLGALYAAVAQMPLMGDDNSVYSTAKAYGYDDIADVAQGLNVAVLRVNTATKLIEKGDVTGAGLQMVKSNQTYMYGEHIESKDAVSELAKALEYDFSFNMNRLSNENPKAIATTDTIFTVAHESDSTGTNLFSTIASVIGDYSGDMNIWLKVEEKEYINEGGYPESEEIESWTNSEPVGENIVSSTKLTYTIKATCGTKFSDWADVDNIKNTGGTYITSDQVGILGSVSKQIAGINTDGVIRVEVKRPNITAYGYSVDLAFQSSEDTDLLLQQMGIGRVSGDGENPDLMGGGSTVQFTVAGDMTTQQVKDLLQGIYIVFMDGNGSIYKVAAVDPNSVEVTWTTFPATATATLALYEPEFDGEGNLSLGRKVTDNVITHMDADKTYYISAVVYLNGDAVDSTAFSAAQGLSMKGALNLQFASSVTLTPMDYDFTAAETKRKDG